MRKLRFPEQLPQIEKARFCHPECLAAFLDVCDELILEDPARSLEVAAAAPGYAERVEAACGDPSLAMRARGVYGSAFLAGGRYREADDVFRQAEKIEADDDERAALACRIAHLRCGQRRWAKALEQAGRAVAHLERRYDPDHPELETNRISLATALVTRANVNIEAYLADAGSPPVSPGEPSPRLREAAEDLRRALAVCHSRTDRARLAATHNLGFLAAAAWIGGEPGFYRPSQVVALTRKLRKQLQRQKSIRHCSVIHAKIRWLMGLALAQESMGLTRRAEKYLREAREDLITLGSYSDAARITLDLGWWLLQEREWELLRELTAELVTAPWARRFPADWQAALKLWHKSVRKQDLDPQVLGEVYFKVRGIRMRLPATEETSNRWSTSVGW